MSKTKQYSESTCDGCGKNFEIDRGSYSKDKAIAAKIEIAPDVYVRVCGSSKYNSDYWRHDTQYTPKIGCLRKAFEAKNVCPGCGDERERGEGAFSGICGGCMELIDRAKTTLGDRPTTYSLHTDLISSTWPDSSTWTYGKDTTPRDFSKKLLNVIARIAQSTGPRKGPDDYPHGHGVRLPRTRGSDYGDVAIQLDEKQRAAVEELGAAIKAFADAMYNQGRRAGRDLLGGLATGKVSIRDFEEKHKTWSEEEEETDV